jgi:serine protease Do
MFMSTRKSSIFYGVLIAFSSLVVGMVIASRLDLTPSSLASTLTVPPTNSAPLNGTIDATTFRTIAHDAGPAVVSILTTITRPASESGSLDDLFGQLLPNPRRPPNGRRPSVPRQARGAGSGFIIDKAGYILTNNHVVEDATSIEVKLSTMKDSEPYGLAAKIVGRDELSDTALLQLTEMPKTELVAAKFGDSSQMAPGDWVVAIGNPFELSNTVTVGVVSAVGRQTPVSNGRWEDFIQTDAAINRGNSGGPLLNIRGEVIGINTMIVTEDPTTGGNVGIGFAVPINTVRDLLPQLREGKVVRGRIGVTVGREPISEDYAKDLGLPAAGGAEIRSVEAGGPAASAGMRLGDIVIEVNGRPVRDNDDLVAFIASTKPGITIPIKVVRDRKTITLNVTVAELNLEQEQGLAADNDANTPPPNEPTDVSLGMTIREMTPADRRQLQVPGGRGGAIVTDVTDFGPASQASIAPGDVILSVQGNNVRSVDEVSTAIDRVPNGGTVRIVVWRGGRTGGQEILMPIRKR